MAGKDELPLSLPDPPPPAPARREAAIEAAMARFDGAGRSMEARPRQRPRWRPAMQRPYLVSAMALSLLALVVAPVAWMHMPREEASAPKMADHSVQGPPKADVETPPAPMPPAPVEVSEEPPAAAPSRPAAAPPLLAQAPAPPPPPPPVAEKATEPAQGYQAMVAPPMAAPSAPAAASAPAIAARAEARRARMAADSGNSDDIVVTSVRADPTLLRGRGDWNACTVQDPQRDLSVCKRQVDSAAKGDRGLAAAHMADGLTHAWQGDWQEAIAAFDKAIAVAPKSSQAYLNRALAYQAQDDSDRALQDFNTAIRYAPHAARGYYLRSLLLRQRGETRKAEADRQHAAELDSRYAPD